MRKASKLLAGLLTMGISLSLLTPSLALAGEEEAITTEPTAQEDTNSAIPDESQSDAASVASDNTQAPDWPAGPEITSESAVVMEDSTSTVLYSKNPDTILQPGSPVKIMTVLLALEKGTLTDQIPVTSTATSVVSESYANISLTEGESLTLEDYLYAIMLASANDAALQVAEYIGGSVEAFADMMNTRAQELGCTNTVFTNPTGLPEDGQQSTAHDLALITKAALDNPQFRTIASAASYTINSTDYSDARNLTNNFALLQSEDENYYDGCLGGKEGYTDESLSTLTCGAIRNDMLLITVVMKGENIQTEEEAVTLLDYGYSNFQKLQMSDPLSTISGGIAVIPAQATRDHVTVRESLKSEGTQQEYYYGSTPVGSGLIQTILETQEETRINGEANLQAAQELSSGKSMTPYYVIIAVGVVLLAGLLVLMIRIIKS